MNASDLFPPSDFLKSEDVDEAGGEMLLTIIGVGKKEFDGDNGKKEVKGVLVFAEIDKKLTSNATNTRTIVAMYGDQDIDKNWIGKKITLYVDEHVQYAGKETRGIRVRLIDKKQDAVTAYWSRSRELGFDQAAGLKLLAECNKDFELALSKLASAADFPE